MSALMSKLFPLKGEAASVSTSPRNPINGDKTCGSFAEPVVMRMILKYIQAKERMILFRKAKQIVELAEMSSSDWRGQFQQVLTISCF